MSFARVVGPPVFCTLGRAHKWRARVARCKHLDQRTSVGRPASLRLSRMPRAANSNGHGKPASRPALRIHTPAPGNPHLSERDPLPAGREGMSPRVARLSPGRVVTGRRCCCYCCCCRPWPCHVPLHHVQLSHLVQVGVVALALAGAPWCEGAGTGEGVDNGALSARGP